MRSSIMLAYIFRRMFTVFFIHILRGIEFDERVIRLAVAGS